MPKLKDFCLSAGRTFKVGGRHRAVVERLESAGVTFHHWSPDW
jgi:hypothetical protein